jgi:hypothetical protein
MLALEDFAPTRHEKAEIAAYPEQVAIGYLRAWRKANGGKRSDGRPIYDSDRYNMPDMDGLLNLFKPREDR